MTYLTSACIICELTSSSETCRKKEAVVCWIFHSFQFFFSQSTGGDTGKWQILGCLFFNSSFVFFHLLSPVCLWYPQLQKSIRGRTERRKEIMTMYSISHHTGAALFFCGSALIHRAALFKKFHLERLCLDGCRWGSEWIMHHVYKCVLEVLDTGSESRWKLFGLRCVAALQTEVPWNCSTWMFPCVCTRSSGLFRNKNINTAASWPWPIIEEWSRCCDGE